jgi:uncharacterized protein
MLCSASSLGQRIRARSRRPARVADCALATSSLLDVTHRLDRSTPLHIRARDDRLVTAIRKTIAMRTAQPIQDQHAIADVVSASAAPFAPFARQRTVLLTTFRRDGTPVKTPVSIAVDGDRAYIRSWDSAGKVKRIRNNLEVTIAPCTARGRPTGPAMTARARILTDQEFARTGRLLANKHPILQGLLVPFAHRLRGNTTTHIELTRSTA